MCLAHARGTQTLQGGPFHVHASKTNLPVLAVHCLGYYASRRGASDDAAKDLVAPGATVEKLAGGFAFTEGPACGAHGNVYFTDIPNNRIHKWDVSNHTLSTIREQTGGANGLYFDRHGNLLACEGTGRQLTSTKPDGTTIVLVNKYEGKRFNSPNDLWIDPHGGVYFTDPRYGGTDSMEQDGFHVYYLKPDHQTVVRVLDDLVKPNGVVGTSDGKLLYVADPGDNKTYVYVIQADGTLRHRKLIAPSGSDGMTLDEQGNLYLTGDGVLVFNPAGEQIATIDVPERPSNVCFGGAVGKTLFITARTGFYALKMQVGGQPGAAAQ